MKINKILKDFVKECSEKLNLMSIVQFGSSTYLENPNDIDLVFISNDLVFPVEDYRKLLLILKSFENKYSDVSFDMSTPLYSRAKYKITIVPLQRVDLIYQSDKFFLRSLLKDKNRKILFGKDPLSNLKIIFSKGEIIKKLTLEINFYMRLKAEKKPLKDLKEYISYFFKAVFRLMLIGEDVYKREDLVRMFRKKYPGIEIPKNYKKILDHKAMKDDFLNILKFSTDCLRFLAKPQNKFMNQVSKNFCVASF